MRLDFASGRPHPCIPEMERIAYSVQQFYLAQHGVDFWRATGYTPAKLAAISECRVRVAGR